MTGSADSKKYIVATDVGGTCTDSLEAARDVYGVVLTDGAEAVDEVATTAAREDLYAARLRQEAAE